MQEASELPEILEESEEAIEVATKTVSEDEGIEAYASFDDYDYVVDGIKYRIIDGELEVVTSDNYYKRDFVIQETVDGYRVTSIGYRAFYFRTALESIKIPNSVTSIGEEAFEQCTNLASVEIPDGVISIGYRAFFACESFTSIKIPNSVTSIEDAAFSHCSGLTSIEIPKGVTSIGYGAFSSCTSLKSIEIPNSVTSISNSTFSACTSLTSIKIPKEVTSIGEYAFHKCSNLTSIEIPDSVTSVGRKTFSGCSSLTSIKIPKGVTSIGEEAFSNCSGLGTLEIVIPTDGTDIKIPQVAADAFDGVGTNIGDDELSIEFVLEAGTELTEEEAQKVLQAAQMAYRNYNDGTPGDDYWYGWKIGDSYPIEYHLEDYNAPKEYCKYIYGVGLTLPIPMKDEYVFSGWYEKPDYSGDKISSIGAAETGEKKFYGKWINDETATKYIIEASAGEGGNIFPSGNVSVQEGGSQTFVMTPNEGYRIKTVMIDGVDKTEEITDSTRAGAVRARAAAGRYYTFSDVRENHTIRVTFVAENGSGDTGGGNGDDSGSGGDDSGNGGGASGGGSEAGGNTGDNNNTDADGNSFINTSSIDRADGSVLENSSINTNAHDNNNNSSNNSNSNNNSTNNNTSNPSKDTEPKTGDTSQVEIYATVAMIAGLTYLLLYFADKEKGMSEEEKQEIISSMIRWAKSGSRLRRYVVLVPIFILLCYYHSIGKRVDEEWESIDWEYIEWESLT